jgi:hypothetical protein
MKMFLNLFLLLPGQLDCLKWAFIQAHVTISATFDIEIWRFAWVGLHDGARLANLYHRAGLTGLTEIVVDADTDKARHDFAEYNRIILSGKFHFYAQTPHFSLPCHRGQTRRPARG